MILLEEKSVTLQTEIKDMKRLHFQPIQGKASDIIDAILHTEEVASLGNISRIIHLVVEEVVVNIESYSCSEYLDVEIIRQPERITFRFRDGGVPFNPLEIDAPDTTIPMGQRQIGGLGIYLVIKKAESVAYEYTNGENVFTVSLQTNKTVKSCF